MELPQGTLLQGGKFRIERVLGQGGFGITYLAKNTAFDDEVAIKEFFWQGVNDRDINHRTVTVSNRRNEKVFNEQLGKFRKEARRIRKLHHPHIVSVEDLFSENGTAYYVMDYIEGESLSQKLDRIAAPLDETTVRGYLLQLLDALAEVHAQQLWHLDVKPGNVLVDHKGQVRLIDFGASKQMKVGGGATTNTQAAYTPGYAPMEQVSQQLEDVGPWTDLYATGALCYRLLTKHHPPESYDILRNGESAFHFTANVSKEMRRLIVWMMRPNHKDRPQSVSEVKSRLGASAPPVEDNDVTVVSPQSVSPLHDEVFTVKGVSFKMIAVEGGTFMMGATAEQGNDVFDDEKPAHEVTLTSFCIGETVVTQKLWVAVMGSNPSEFHGDYLPVENVSFGYCQVFIETLNALTGKRFRLPTEAEWEFAARGGNRSRGFKYAGGDNFDDVAWHSGNSGNLLGFNQKTHLVGMKSPNELGIYDMSGNVWEWCHDWYGKDYYRSSPSVNPTGPCSGAFRILRGGCWYSDVKFCRVSYRIRGLADYCNNTFGLRLAL